MNGSFKITDSNYFTSEGLSNSFLLRFDRSPSHAFTYSQQTEGMRTGSIFHKFILEPEDFKEKYIISPYCDRRTKDYKDWSKDQTKEIIIESDIAGLENAFKNIYTFNFEGKPLADKLLLSEKEIAMYWDYFIGDNVLQLKGKLDALYISGNNAIIFDLKKTQDCRDFYRSVINYKYYRQAAFYKSGLEILKPDLNVRFIFIIIEETPPHGVQLVELDGEYIKHGEDDNYESLLNYLSWDGNKKQGYKNEVVTLFKPEWMK